jgi:hypothetical protein
MENDSLSCVINELLLVVVEVQNITLVARCELHSVAEVKGSEILLTVNALNEFDSRITGVDWRQKRENQRGAVSANFFIFCIVYVIHFF